jgi:hypothetical protein
VDSALRAAKELTGQQAPHTEYEFSSQPLYIVTSDE